MTKFSFHVIATIVEIEVTEVDNYDVLRSLESSFHMIGTIAERFCSDGSDHGDHMEAALTRLG